MDENYVGPIFVGQRWVELRGVFTLGELKAITGRIEDNFTEAFNDKKIKDSKESAEHLQNIENALNDLLDGDIDEELN